MYNGSTFWVVFGEKMHFKQSAAACNKDGRGRLANIYSEEHYNKTFAYMRSRNRDTEDPYIAAWTGMKREFPVRIL